MKFISCLALVIAAMPAMAQDRPAPLAGTEVTEPASPDPAALRLATEILEIVYPPDKRLQIFSSRIKSLTDRVRAVMSQHPQSKDPEFQAVLDRNMERMWASFEATMNHHLPALLEDFARAYARMFTMDDLRAIRAFASTPAGQHFLQHSSELLSDPDVAAENRRMMDDMLAQSPRLQSDMVKDIQEYLAKKRTRAQSAAGNHS